jgi:hypothetical protein
MISSAGLGLSLLIPERVLHVFQPKPPGPERCAAHLEVTERLTPAAPPRCGA